MFRCGYNFFLTCAIVPIIFANDCLKNFLLEILGFLSPKLATNDHFMNLGKDSAVREIFQNSLSDWWLLLFHMLVKSVIFFQTTKRSVFILKACFHKKLKRFHPHQICCKNQRLKFSKILKPSLKLLWILGHRENFKTMVKVLNKIIIVLFFTETLLVFK